MSTEKTEIEITIDQEGNISYEIKGVKGSSCTETTEFLDKALGEIVQRKFTREYYEQAVGVQKNLRTRR